MKTAIEKKKRVRGGVKSPFALIPIAEIKKQLFKRGNLEHKLKAYQKPLYWGLHEDRDFQTILCTRRFGKTFTLICYAIEKCIKNPNFIVRVLAPTQKQLIKIILPSIRKILNDCPEDVLPLHKKQEGMFKFPNGSEIHLFGCDNGNGENLRGLEANLVIIDEAGFISDFHYLLTSVILPTVLETNGKVICSSTRSKTPTHYFETLVDEATVRGDLLEFNIHDTDYTDYQIARMCEKVGGETSSDWRREFLNERIIDEHRAVITTWNDSNIGELIPDSYHPYYHRYTMADLGFSRDLTVFLFATYHFPTATLYVHDEWFGKRQSTKDIATNCKLKERENFGSIVPYMRLGDTDNPLLYNDLSSEYNYEIFGVRKTSREAMLNKLSVWMSENRIKISPKCKLLLTTIKSALWNKNKTDFERNEETGHADSLMALVYGVHSIDVYTNPVPLMAKTTHNTFVHPDYQDENRSNLENLRKAFQGN